MAASSAASSGSVRILLPPNLAAAATRDAIVVKVEGAATALPAALQSACRGNGPWILQMRRPELRALVHLLAGQPVFFWVNRPTQLLAWRGTELTEVSEYLAEKPPAPAPQRETPPSAPPAPPAGARAPVSVRSAPSGVTVDGSEHFLALTLPRRDHPAHAPLLAAVQAAGFILDPSSRKWWLRDRHRTLAFLAEYWDRLEHEWGAVFTPNFVRNTARISRARVVAQTREQGDELDVELTLEAGGISAEAVQTHLSQGRNYVEAGAALVLVAPAVLVQLRDAQRRLADDPQAPLLARSRHCVARHRAGEAAETLEALDPNLQLPETWRRRSEALRQLSRLTPAPLPTALAGQLRDYQRLGVAWLYHLYEHGLGGILADEMGLGKTAQALGLLVAARTPEQSPASPPSRAATIPAPALVVCPASLTENWRREALRFAPQLRVFVHHGATRLDSLSGEIPYDLIVTSYGMLVRDQALFAAPLFSCVIADEAQHAKNRRTQAAQALRALRARARFCLTGTPVENSLDDLRTLFDFVLPGAVAPMPADVRGEDRTWHADRLRRQTAHYILRRTKAQVATELPPKIEQIIWCEATAAQRRLYEEVRSRTEREIDALALAGRPESQVRLAVLTQLLRLRQTCCDPRLVAGAASPLSGDDSAKLAALRELLDEAIDDGHRMLIFSQFTALLALVREELTARELSFCYLDGSMSGPARQAEVDRFQNDPAVPVFLISLKAGGTGLNLTGADTVVHLDPWWNPAVEAQATDRAHRLGQTRIVTSYKLIVPGTVEEKVLQLQAAKRKLLADVFEASDAINARFELSDLRSLVRTD